jgi:hypothetical protein
MVNQYPTKCYNCHESLPIMELIEALDKKKNIQEFVNKKDMKWCCKKQLITITNKIKLINNHKE